MKTIKSFINEKLTLNKQSTVLKYNYNYHPKDFDELRSLLEKLLEKRGKDADLNDIDVSKITLFGDTIKKGKHIGFSGLFYGLDPHNIDISEWDVSNAEDMSYMFYRCTNFTGQGLENWKPLKVKDMSFMFYECKNFNCDLSDWDVSNVKDKWYMFDGCTSLKDQYKPKLI